MRLFGLLTLMAAAEPALAGPFDYDFDGDLSSHFVSLPFPGLSPLVQDPVGEQLDYDNGGATDLENDNAGLLALFAPTYTQSWTVSVDVTIPASYDGALVDDPGVFDVIGSGLAALHNLGQPNDADQFAIDATLEVTPGGRQFLATADRQDAQGEEFRFDEADLVTALETTTVRLTFDSETKILTSLADNDKLIEIDIDAPGTDWGMVDSDTFDIALFVFSEFEAVSEDAPVTLDNFRAAIIPEPAGLALAFTLLGMAVRSRTVS